MTRIHMYIGHLDECRPTGKEGISTYLHVSVPLMLLHGENSAKARDAESVRSVPSWRVIQKMTVVESTRWS